MRFAIFVGVVCLVFSSVGCDRFKAQSGYSVKRVSDGDTIVVADGAKNTTVRFACTDAPEVPHSQKERSSRKVLDKNQFSWGLKAQNRVQQLVKQGGDRVLLTVTDTDKYGRKVSEVRLPNGTLIQTILVQEGLALVYRDYLKKCPSAAEIEQAEARAKQNLRGVWGDPKFTPPWEYRKK